MMSHREAVGMIWSSVLNSMVVSNIGSDLEWRRDHLKLQTNLVGSCDGCSKTTKTGTLTSTPAHHQSIHKQDVNFDILNAFQGT